MYDQFQKTAGLADTAGLTAGVVGTGMGSLGMLAALMSYQEASKRRKSVILNKAMNSWQRRMWREQPPAVAVQPGEGGTDQHDAKGAKAEAFIRDAIKFTQIGRAHV